MSILNEIQEWSKNLSAWQQDAVARLYSNRNLSVADMEDLYALAKAEAGIPDQDGRVANKLQDAQIAPPAASTRHVQLTGIREVNNVNALANGGRLPIALAALPSFMARTGPASLAIHECLNMHVARGIGASLSFLTHASILKRLALPKPCSRQ